MMPTLLNLSGTPTVPATTGRAERPAASGGGFDRMLGGMMPPRAAEPRDSRPVGRDDSDASDKPEQDAASRDAEGGVALHEAGRHGADRHRLSASVRAGRRNAASENRDPASVAEPASDKDEKAKAPETADATVVASEASNADIPPQFAGQIVPLPVRAADTTDGGQAQSSTAGNAVLATISSIAPRLSRLQSPSEAVASDIAAQVSDEEGASPTTGEATALLGLIEKAQAGASAKPALSSGTALSSGPSVDMPLARHGAPNGGPNGGDAHGGGGRGASRQSAGGLASDGASASAITGSTPDIFAIPAAGTTVASGMATGPQAVVPATTDIGATLDARTIDMGASGQWIDGLAHEIATLSAGTGQGSFRLSPEYLGPMRVDIRSAAEGSSVTLTVETQAAEQVLNQDKGTLKADARLANLHIADVKVERVTQVAESARAENGGAHTGGQQGASHQQPGLTQQQAGQDMAGRSGNGQQGRKFLNDAAVLRGTESVEPRGDASQARRARYA